MNRTYIQRVCYLTIHSSLSYQLSRLSTVLLYPQRCYQSLLHYAIANLYFKCYFHKITVVFWFGTSIFKSVAAQLARWSAPLRSYAAHLLCLWKDPAGGHPTRSSCTSQLVLEVHRDVIATVLRGLREHAGPTGSPSWDIRGGVSLP